MIEAGTGSGSFSHAVAGVVGSGWKKDKGVKPREGGEDAGMLGEEENDDERWEGGRVWSFEYHATRFEKAR